MLELPPELLDAILADWHGDAPRLAAADWLEEGGDADWAGLIRAQCRLAARGRVPLPRGAVGRLQAHEARVRDTFRDRLDVALGNSSVPVAFFDRGFVDQFQIVCDGVTAVPSNALVALTPLLVSLVFDAGDPLPVSALAGLSRLRTLQYLQARLDVGELTWEHVEPLADCATLAVVSLYSQDLRALRPDLVARLRSEAIARALADPARREGTAALALGSFLRELPGGGRAVEANPVTLPLADALPGVVRLSLDGESAGEPLAARPVARNLRSLTLTGRAVVSPGCLLGLPPLRELRVMATGQTGDGRLLASALREQPGLRSLSVLGPWRDAAGILDAVNACRELRVLHLGANARPDLARLDLPELLAFDLAGVGAMPRDLPGLPRLRLRSGWPLPPLSSDPISVWRTMFLFPEWLVRDPGEAASRVVWREWGDAADEALVDRPTVVTLELLPGTGRASEATARLAGDDRPPAVLTSVKKFGHRSQRDAVTPEWVTRRYLWPAGRDRVLLTVRYAQTWEWAWRKLSDAIADSLLWMG